jgi:hypothetical protein
MRAAGMLAMAWGVCAIAVGAEASSSWKFMCYQGFVESVDKLVGPDAIDCGLIDQQSEKVTEARKLGAVRCVEETLHGVRPFKFGMVPAGSNVVYLLLRSPAGELWTVRYERSIANKHLHETQINQTCKNVSFDSGALIIQGADCKVISIGGLPTYEPNPGH